MQLKTKVASSRRFVGEIRSAPAHPSLALSMYGVIEEGTEKVLKGRHNVAQGATDDKPRAEGKLAFTMPRCEGGKSMKWINPVC